MNAFDVVGMSAKGIQILDASQLAYKISKNPKATKDEKIVAALNIAFAGAQIGDLICFGIPGTPIPVKITTSLIAGSFDIARTVAMTRAVKIKEGGRWTKKDTISAIAQNAGIIMFRIGDVVGAASALSDLPLHMDRFQMISNTTRIIGSASIGVQSVISIHSSIQKIKQTLEKRENKRRENPTSATILSDIPLRQGTQAARREGMRNRSVNVNLMYPESEAEQYQREIQNLIHFSGRLTELTTIPDIIADEEQLMLYRCPIAKWPIRFSFVLNLSQEIIRENPGLAELTYERREIERWIRECPNKMPPFWPIELLPLPVRNSYFKVERYRQAEIDRALDCIIERFRNDLLIAASE